MSCLGNYVNRRLHTGVAVLTQSICEQFLFIDFFYLVFYTCKLSACFCSNYEGKEN